MFTRPLSEILKVCLSIIAFSVFIDILTSKLNIYLNRRITEYQDSAIDNEIYKPLIQRFGRYISLIDAVLNILIANLIGVISPQYLNPVCWLSIIVLVIDVVILLPRYHQLVSKIRYIKAKSKERAKGKF